MENIQAFVSYVRSRLSEPSSWAAFGAGVAAGAALPPPWSAVMVACSIVGVLLPEAKK